MSGKITDLSGFSQGFVFKKPLLSPHYKESIGADRQDDPITGRCATDIFIGSINSKEIFFLLDKPDFYLADAKYRDFYILLHALNRLNLYRSTKRHVQSNSIRNNNYDHGRSMHRTP